MILTVTPNTTMDQTMFLPVLNKGKTLRASRTVHSMGGKPTDASFILGALGIPSLALGCAAGPIGDKITVLLQARGVTVSFTPVGGESRMNVIIIDESDHTMTTITVNTLQVAPEAEAALLAGVEASLGGASVMVTGGTLPSGLAPAFYAGLIERARRRGTPVIFDAAEPNLSAGLVARPTLIKPNIDELSGLAGRPLESLAEVAGAARALHRETGVQPVVTMGADGALAVLDHAVYFIPPLRVPVVSAAGAGDAVLAGLAASIERGQPIEDGLRLGIAAAAAVCMMPGTGDCRAEDVWRLLPQVELQPYSA
jgi:1-phosphofructokinase